MLAKLNEIIIQGDRQRREFDPAAVRELRQSIREQGLLHAVSVRRIDNRLVLVAGETRLRAIEGISEPYRYGELMVDPGFVPVTDFGEITQVHAEELELFENVRRKNLTWQEETDAWARLHVLRSSQNSRQTRAQTVSEILQSERLLEVGAASRAAVVHEDQLEVVLQFTHDELPGGAVLPKSDDERQEWSGSAPLPVDAV